MFFLLHLLLNNRPLSENCSSHDIKGLQSDADTGTATFISVCLPCEKVTKFYVDRKVKVAKRGRGEGRG